MATTDVKYLGLDLKSPVVVSSCSLTADVDKVKEMESCGAGAVVMKSLFEEQIRGEVEFMASAGHSYPEMDDYLHAYIRSNSIAQYTEKVRALKQAVSIPVIASINCYSAGEWVEYARQIEAAGADALEINLYDIALDPKTSPASIEDGYVSVVRSIVSGLRIPVAVKIGPHYTSIVNFVDRIAAAGAKGVVIFNRFFTPDIDLDKFTLVPAAPLVARRRVHGDPALGRHTLLGREDRHLDHHRSTQCRQCPEDDTGRSRYRAGMFCHIQARTFSDTGVQHQDCRLPRKEQRRGPLPDPRPPELLHHTGSRHVRARPVHEDLRVPGAVSTGYCTEVRSLPFKVV